MARKRLDPKLANLYQEREKAAEEEARWFARVKRAINKVSKARQKIIRLQHRIELHLKETNT